MESEDRSTVASPDIHNVKEQSILTLSLAVKGVPKMDYFWVIMISIFQFQYGRCFSSVSFHRAGVHTLLKKGRLLHISKGMA